MREGGEEGAFCWGEVAEGFVEVALGGGVDAGEEVAVGDAVEVGGEDL